MGTFRRASCDVRHVTTVRETFMKIALVSFALTISSFATAEEPVKFVSGNTNLPPRSTNVVRITSAFVTALAEEMRTNHPALHALRWRADAATENVRSIRTWDDPMARVGGM